MHVRKYRLFFVCWQLHWTTSFASYDISLNQLFDNPTMYNGQKVVVTGEVVGDIMSEGEGFWINIKDSNSFIGVFIQDVDRAKITKLGRYRIIGDIVRITGIYNEHCTQHFGENDINAENLEIIQPGEATEETIDFEKIVISFVLGIITILFLIHSHRMAGLQGTSDKPS